MANQLPQLPGLNGLLAQAQQAELQIANLLAQPARAMGMTLPAPPPGPAAVLSQIMAGAPIPGAPGATPRREERTTPGVKTTVL